MIRPRSGGTVGVRLAASFSVLLVTFLIGCASPAPRRPKKARQGPAPEAAREVGKADAKPEETAASPGEEPGTRPAAEAEDRAAGRQVRATAGPTDAGREEVVALGEGPDRPPADEPAAAETAETAKALNAAPYVLSEPAPRCRNYYVDQGHPAARDSAPGTEDAPFKTISKAAEVVEAGDVVTIMPGTYREAVGIRKAGTKDKPIVFQARRKGAAVITGADPLTGWRKEPGARPAYSVHWPHDFIINTTMVEGKRVFIRNHGAGAPVGCAEQVVWDGRPLRQVMTPEEMGPGAFRVDWDADRLFVWLPGGIDPNATQVLGCPRSLQFGRGGHWGNWAEAKYITLKGLTFRYASNFAQRGGVKYYTGWRIEDCLVEWNNAGGVGGEGEDIVLLRVISQDNGFSGIGGSRLRNVLVKDCVSRRNNRKGFPVGWDGGGGKWLHSDGLRIVNHTANDNVGPGIWLDWDNRNYVIENCVSYGNYGNRHSWEGAGVFTEANDGPGRIANNVIYSNTGGGISIAEGQHLVVEGNVLVDNGSGVDFRAMEGRAQHKLENVVVRANRFKDWRGAAISTSLGTWGRDSAAEKKLTIDANVYDPPEGGALFNWAGEKISSLEEARRVLGVEKAGSVAEIAFDRELVPSQNKAAHQSFGIDEAIGDAPVGATVVMPANGRTSVSKAGNVWKCQVYDLANRYVTLALPTAKIRSAVESRIAAYPMTEVVYLKARITRRDGGKIEATVLDLGDEVRRAALSQMGEKKAASRKKTWLTRYPLAERAKPGDWAALDLRGHANRPVTGRDAWIGIPLEYLPPGRHTIHGVPFEVIDGKRNAEMVAVALRSEKFSSTRGKPLPREVEISVGRKAKAVYFLHGAGYAGDHVKVAAYEFVYADGTTSSVDIVPYGKPDAASAARFARESTIQDWWPDFQQFDAENAHQALITNESGEYRRYLYTLQWVNPAPDKAVDRVRLASEPGQNAIILVLSVTVLGD